MLSGAKVKKFLQDHMLAVIVAALGSLATTIGGYVLYGVKTEIDSLQCRIAKFGAANEYRAAQLKLIVLSLVDVRRESEAYLALAGAIQNYETSLAKCAEGAKELHQMTLYRDSLDKFIDGHYDESIAKLQSMTTRTALSEKTLASAFLSKYLDARTTNVQQAQDLKRRWLNHHGNALELAAAESDEAVKSRAIASMRCTHLLWDSPEADAITCLNALVTEGLATCLVYYNLSALHARLGDFQNAVEAMTKCLALPGALGQRRSYIDNDRAFDKLRADAKFGPIFRGLLERLQR